MVVFRFWKVFVLCLPLLFGSVALASQLDSRMTIRGEIDYQAEGSCRGMVLLWSAEGRSAVAPERSNLVPDGVDEITAECHFEIKVPPGSYYLQSVVRQTAGFSLGPLRVGDLVFPSGGRLQVSGNAGDQIHLGTLSTSRKFTGFPEQVETGITGRLIDEKGTPIAGLTVLAFSDAGMVTGLYAVSPPSDDDGRFRLHLVGKAEVYLQAREEIGLGTPPMGSLVGVYGNKAAKQIKVEQGKLVERVEIVVVPRAEEEAADKK